MSKARDSEGNPLYRQMVYSHWLTPGPRPRPGPGQVLCRTFHIAPRPGQGPGRMGCMVLIRTFHTAPGQGQGLGLGKTLLSYDKSPSIQDW